MSDEDLHDDTRRWLDDAVREEAIAPDDRARLWKSISGAIAPAPAPGLFDRSVPLRHVVGIAAVALGAGLAIGHATTPSSVVSSPPVIAPPASAPASASSPASAPAPASASAPASAPASASALAPAHSSPRADTSMDEMRVILRAKRALTDNQPADALVALEEHERAYPHGALAEERDALRVLALCAAGRASEGATERAAFLRAHPFSAYVDRVRAACVP